MVCSGTWFFLRFHWKGFGGRGSNYRFGKPHQLVRPISRNSSGGICLGGSQAPP